MEKAARGRPFFDEIGGDIDNNKILCYIMIKTLLIKVVDDRW